jgi:AcrR family transcriptional regulator
MNEKTNPKRKLILKTGKELFWKFGYKRVTIEELCKEAGISKMTYYKFFPNKIELVKTLMSVVLNEALMKYKKISASELPYPEKVIRMIQLKQEQVDTMSSEFFRDYVQSDDPDLINFLNQLTRENLQMFTNDFKKAQADGDIRADLKVEFIMYMMNHLVEMASDENLLSMYDEPQELVMEITNFLFYGILSRDVHK